MSDLDDFQCRLGWVFQRPELLECALTHKSWSNERPDRTANNERLEFLGDAVLDLAIGHELFAGPHELAEGELTRVRAELVSERGLAAVARELNVGEVLRLGRGERLSGGSEKDSLLANAVEALFGAIFLDGGFAAAAAAARSLFSPFIDRALRDRQGQDYKSRLQERLQGRYGAAPRYRELRVEGPPHDRHYTVSIEFRGRSLAEGGGRSKKEAEQAAARRALELPDV